MKKKIALVTGITGQDGSLIADFLLNKNYKVIGMKRRSSSFNTQRIDHLYKDFQEKNDFIPFYGDLTDSTNILRVIQSVKPDEIYNLGAQSHVHTSFETPEYTANTDALGTLRVLEAIRILNLKKKIKFYQASTSEIFGNSKPPQNEKTAFKPESPYGTAKLYAYWITKNYRESFNIFACNGILFNHESPLRGETFVTKKVVKALCKIKNKKQKKLVLGNIYAKRDWGFAGDYVEGMWLMLQHDTPDDWVLATGETHTVKEFLQKAFEYVDLDWEKFVQTSEKYFRPNEVEHLLGDSTKARKELSWSPKTSFDELVRLMIDHDLVLAEQEKVLIQNNLMTPTWENPTI